MAWNMVLEWCMIYMGFGVHNTRVNPVIIGNL